MTYFAYLCKMKSKADSNVYLQSELLQLSCFIQQFSSELGQQQLLFLLSDLPITEQPLQFTLRPGVFILQSAHANTFAELNPTMHPRTVEMINLHSHSPGVLHFQGLIVGLVVLTAHSLIDEHFLELHIRAGESRRAGQEDCGFPTSSCRLQVWEQGR